MRLGSRQSIQQSIADRVELLGINRRSVFAKQPKQLGKLCVVVGLKFIVHWAGPDWNLRNSPIQL